MMLKNHPVDSQELLLQILARKLRLRPYSSTILNVFSSRTIQSYKKSIGLIDRERTLFTVELPSHFILSQLHENTSTLLICIPFLLRSLSNEVKLPAIVYVQIVVHNVTDFSYQHLVFERLHLH